MDDALLMHRFHFAFTITYHYADEEVDDLTEDSLDLYWGDELLGGWQVNAIANFQTGSPFGVTNQAARGNTGGNDRPNLVRDPHLDAPGAASWFDTATFAAPARFSFGTALETFDKPTEIAGGGSQETGSVRTASMHWQKTRRSLMSSNGTSLNPFGAKCCFRPGQMRFLPPSG